MKKLITSAAALLLATGLAFAQSEETVDQTDTTPAIEEPSAPSPAGLAAWAQLYEVFSHPRCANCHVSDERPRWSGPHYGEEPRVHAMNVVRGPAGFGPDGLQCQTCHAETNSTKLHGPPGAPHWHLAPAEMVWFGQSSADICAQIKDPTRNGGKTLEEVAVHVRDDALVLWGWNPGTGREPAPGSAEETYNLVKTWIAENAPCPEG